METGSIEPMEGLGSTSRVPMGRLFTSPECWVPTRPPRTVRRSYVAISFKQACGVSPTAIRSDLRTHLPPIPFCKPSTITHLAGVTIRRAGQSPLPHSSRWPGATDICVISLRLPTTVVWLRSPKASVRERCLNVLTLPDTNFWRFDFLNFGDGVSTNPANLLSAVYPPGTIAVPRSQFYVRCELSYCLSK